ncbi:CRM-domain containing factor CFM2, chloroplastic isoform X2 [Typha angustifolia]|uniref:CRM-domain containing factor CFM2, chloroplastic isoform X2 n=1 Tax=Typha angustifolia TaxID=59011 RepID=UPI003C2B3244
MSLSLIHSPPFLSSKTLDSPLRQFLPPLSPKPPFFLLLQNPRCSPKSQLRSSSPTPKSATTEALAKAAIKRISEKLRSLGYLADDDDPSKSADQPLSGPGSPGEIFVPTPQEIPKYRVGCTIDSSWSTPENPVPDPGSGETITRFRELWRREREQTPRAKRETVPSVAELTIPADELRRLRSEGIRLNKRIKVGKAGITEGIVNGIHERWRKSELVKIKCEDLCRMNMKRTHETLERKTGGLVVWRSGSIIILYRGADYQYPYFYDDDQTNENLDDVTSEPGTDSGSSSQPDTESSHQFPINSSSDSNDTSARSSLVIGVGSPEKVRLQFPGEVKLEEEADKLLDGLGPRFDDWWGYEPLPIDADLLPATVPGFRKPFRLLPFGIKPKLTDREMTVLRRLGRPLPCHFALGRNRNLQGLAASMIKLWEKCEIAKIAIKRGVQNTNSELMAEELKRLTGGTLLSRDKEFIVFYRGKDFLPPAVSAAIEERRNCGNYAIDKPKQKEESSVTVRDTSEPKFVRGGSVDDLQEREVHETLATERRLKSVNLKIQKAITKREKAEKLLEKLEKSAEPPKVESDREAISEEERYMLRKVGLRMKPFLLLGRRGVFDGTVENMHLHWKYRELVKIISKDRSIEDVESAARILEAESGGILVAVERVSKGHAIIVYRGKNYQRPASLRPKSLLTKKEAMRRSLEAQRRESLKLHVLSLSRNIEQLKHQMIRDDSLPKSTQLSSNGTKDQVGSTNRDNNVSADCEENIEEVTTVASDSGSKEYNDASRETGETIMTSTSVDISAFHLNTVQEDEVVCFKHQHDFSEAEVIHTLEECGNSRTASSEELIYDSSTSDDSSLDLNEDVDSSYGVVSSKYRPTVYEEKMVEESDNEVPFRAAPLSNRERLLLRKQALKMRKRPVIAVGRNNVLSGVAKTIKTHFKKHPLAIVNIKGRATGTSVQQLIFELEQATGAVLVSREPNKVILYRGWGEGDTPGTGKENDVNTFRVGDGISPQLMEAIRVECGLHFREGE